MSEKPEILTVVARKGKDKKAHDRVVLFEQNDDHPGKEAYVTRDGVPVSVALTAKVKTLLGQGDLERTDEPVPAPRQPKGKDAVAVEPVEEAEEEDDLEEDAESEDKPLPAGVNRGGRPRKVK